MATTRIEKATHDSRGLPQGMDPHMFYEYRRLKVLEQSPSGLEGLLWKVIPWSFIRSFAIAIDPLSALKVSPIKITPTNRTRYLGSVSVLNNSTWVLTKSGWSEGNPPNYGGISPNFGPTVVSNYSSDRTNGAATKQPAFLSYVKDTTRRTRLIGSDFGEFEKFKFAIYAPQKVIDYSLDNKVYNYYLAGPSGLPSYSGSISHYNLVDTPGGYLSTSAFNAITATDKQFLTDTMSKRGLSLYRQALPTSRQYSLSRNIVELRDLPRSILSLRDTLQHFHELVSHLNLSSSLKEKIFSLGTNIKDIPNEYLSFHFGWKQTYNDVMDLLKTPDRITKRINRLIARNGLATTYTSKLKFADVVSDGPGFARTDSSSKETDLGWKHSRSRKVELRCVLNSTFDFPTVDLPSFRDSYFRKMLGLTPTFTDLYNLTPWTWMFDWFTGFGNYLEIIEEINNDRSLINFGFLTGVIQSELISQHTGRVKNDSTYRIDNVVFDNSSTVFNHYNCSATFEYQIRKDLSTILDVRATSDLSSLSTFQRTIIGALFAQRTHISPH